MQTYFPMTADILTPGHIMCLETLSGIGPVVIGLLTDKALRGYKKNIVPYKDRKYVLDKIAESFWEVTVVPQETLDPTSNVIRYGCKAIASGDGWEPSELQTIKKLKLVRIDIKLPGEGKKKRYSSTAVKNKIR